MWRLEKSFTFEAAHMLEHHDGKCARLHGHSFKAIIVIEDYELHLTGPKEGMVIDYGDISAVVKPVIDEYLDHRYLNESLRHPGPTSELIAQWLFKKLEPELPGLAEVIIEETCTSRCVYRPDRTRENTVRGVPGVYH